MRKKRDYKREYRRYHSKPLQKKRRAKRNAARQKMIKAGKARKGDGKDVHHRNGKMNNSASNLALISRSKNRSFKRSKTNKNLGLRKKTTRKK